MKSFLDEIGNATDLLASKAHGVGYVVAKAKLAKQFPNLTCNDLIEIYSAACNLHQIAYTVTSDSRDKEHSISTAKSLLRQECPGFSEEVYEQAFNDGMFESLW